MRLILIFFSLLTTMGMAEIINVPADQPDIQTAINSATEGDTILVNEGTYYENISFSGKSITVGSLFLIDQDTSHISNTIINGSQFKNSAAASVVTFNSGEDSSSVLKGFTITGGRGTEYTTNSSGTYPLLGGGGVFITNGAKIVNNRIISNSLISSTKSAHGAGIFIDTGFGNQNNVIVKYNLVSMNESEATAGASGGGITIFGDSNVLISCNEITKNRVAAINPIDFISGGGGLHVNATSPEIINNIIAGNEAPYGGGIVAWAGVLNINFRLINNTIADNNAMLKGGGVYLYNGKWTTINNIFWNNSAPEDSNIFFRGEMDISYSIIPEFFPGIGNLQDDPLFQENSYFLSEASPAIDSGNPDEAFNDPADPDYPSLPLSPARGTLASDIGAFGGNDNIDVEIGNYAIRENFEYRQFEEQYYRFSYPLDYDSTLLYPLTIILTGAETSNDDHDGHMSEALFWRINGQHNLYNDFVVAPQSNDEWNGSGELERLYQLIRETAINFPIDTTKIVITGFSSGGNAAIRLLNKDADLFSSAVLIAPNGPDDPERFKYVPLWIFRGENDNPVTGPNIVNNLENGGLEAVYTRNVSYEDQLAAIDSGVRLFYSEIPGAGHNIIRYVYDTELMYDWVKLQKKPLVRPVPNTGNATFYQSGIDTVKLTTRFLNQSHFSFDAHCVTENLNTGEMQTYQLFDDGLHGDSLEQDGVWGSTISPLQNEARYRFGIQVNNLTLNDRFYFQNLGSYTTTGPVQPVNIITLNYNPDLRRHIILLVLQNKGVVESVDNLSVTLSTNDPGIESFGIDTRPFPDLAPGQTDTSLSSTFFSFYYAEGYGPDDLVAFDITISSNGYPYWKSTHNNITAIEYKEQQSPRQFSLLQNYPNPFNPTTAINYQLAMKSDVELSIYNLLGQKVATLVNKRQAAGNYQIEWNASGFASGIYYYHLKAGDFEEVKKMVLIK